MSKSTVERIAEGKVRVTITADAAEVDKAIEVAKAIVAGLKERPLGPKQLGRNPEETEVNAVRQRATRAIAESGIKRAVDMHGLRLASNPKSELEALVEEGKPYSFSLELETVPEFELEGYENLVVTYDADTTVTDADIDARLEEIRGRSAQVEKDSGKPVSANDILEISFTSYLDGEAYEGNTATGYTYIMGSEYLPKAFEAGLLGMKAGESRSIEFTVPQDYGNPEIEGKQARFDVEVNRVSTVTLPEVDDAFAQEFGYEDLAFWRNKIKGELASMAEGEIEERKEKAAREALADCLLGQPDDAMVDAHAEKMLQAFKLDLKNQGTDFAEYCRFLNLTEQDVKEEMKIEGRVLLREGLALEGLFRALGFQIDDAALQETVTQLSEESGMPQAVSYEEFNQEQQAAVREMTMHRMATEWLLEHATFQAA